MKKLFTISIILFFLSCFTEQPDLKELTENQKFDFFKTIFSEGKSTGPPYISFYIKNIETGEIRLTCVENNKLWWLLEELDSIRNIGLKDGTLFENGSFDNRILKLDDSVFNYHPKFGKDVQLKLAAIDSILEAGGDKKELIEFKRIRKNRLSLSYGEISDELINKDREQEKKFIKYFINHGRYFCQYLFDHGIETFSDCEDGSRRMGRIYAPNEKRW